MRGFALLVATIIAALIVVHAGQGIETPKPRSKDHGSRIVRDAERRDTPATFVARYDRAVRQLVAVHLKDHTWLFPKGMTRRQRLHAYRIVAAHDRYVIRGSRGMPLVLRHHRHELAHALAHIRKIRASLAPVHRYPWWWVPLGICETGSNPPDPAYNGADGYDGWINFLPSTWNTYKGIAGASRYAYAWQAPEWIQYLVTMAMHNSGIPWSQSNPECSARIGLS